jgi:hypothetical protein
VTVPWYYPSSLLSWWYNDGSLGTNFPEYQFPTVVEDTQQFASCPVGTTVATGPSGQPVCQNQMTGVQSAPIGVRTVRSQRPVTCSSLNLSCQGAI